MNMTICGRNPSRKSEQPLPELDFGELRRVVEGSVVGFDRLSQRPNLANGKAQQT